MLPDVYWINAVAAGFCMFGKRATAGDFERLTTLSTESIVVTSERRYRAKPQSLRHGDENARSRVAQDAGLTPRILLDLRELHGRIDRHRHRTGIKNAKERGEEVGPCWKHEGNPVARLDIPCNEPGRHRFRRACKFRITQCGDNGSVVLEDGGMQPAGVLRHMPIEHLKQGSAVGSGLHLR